jgi:transcription elongation GreA/GreB family factor
MMEREFVEKRILELSDLLKNVEIIDEKSSK